VFFLAFDQLIDLAEVAQVVTISIGKTKRYSSVVVCPPDRVGRDHPFLKQFIKNAQDGKWIAFTCSRPLPYDCKVTVSVGPNIPSKEGPLRQPAEEVFTFTTVPVFGVADFRADIVSRTVDVIFNQPIVNEGQTIADLVRFKYLI
jgi:hypothetical protein